MGILRSDDTNAHYPVSTTFDPQTGLIAAHVDKVDYGFVDQPVRYRGKTFQPKSELHITIVSEDAGIILKHLESHPDDVIDINDLLLSTDWSFIPLDEFYYVEEKPGVETIIQLVELPGLRSFLKDLSRLTGQGFILPPMHITLYTRGMEKGISIPDQNKFQELAKARILPGEVRLEEDSPARPGDEQGLA